MVEIAVKEYDHRDDACFDTTVEMSTEERLLAETLRLEQGHRIQVVRQLAREANRTGDLLLIEHPLIASTLQRCMGSRTALLALPTGTLYQWGDLPQRLDKTWHQFQHQEFSDRMGSVKDLVVRLLESGDRILVIQNASRCLDFLGALLAKGLISQGALTRVRVVPDMVDLQNNAVFSAWVQSGCKGIQLATEPGELVRRAWLHWAMEAWDTVMPLVLRGRVIAELRSQFDMGDRVALALLLWVGDDRTTVPVRVGSLSGESNASLIGLARVSEQILLELLGAGVVVGAHPQRRDDFLAQWLQGWSREDETLESHWNFWLGARQTLAAEGVLDPSDLSKLSRDFAPSTHGCVGRGQTWNYHDLVCIAQLDTSMGVIGRRYLEAVCRSSRSESGAWWQTILRRPSTLGGEYSLDIWLPQGQQLRDGTRVSLVRGQPMDSFGRSLSEFVVMWRQLQLYEDPQEECRPLRLLLKQGYLRHSGGRVYLTQTGRTLREYVASRWPGILTVRYANDVALHLNHAASLRPVERSQRLRELLADLAYRVV